MSIIRNPLFAPAVLLVAALSGCATKATTAPAGNYIAADAIDVKSVLADPPADNSAAARAELEQMLAIQKARTPEQVARLKAEGAMSSFVFAEVIGPTFNPKKLPATDRLLNRASADAKATIDKAKGLWNRKRPWVTDGRIEPCVAKPADFSYPSDRTCRTYVWALVLAELFPEKKDSLLAKAKQVGEDRVLSGVHYPSDVQAGAALGKVIADRIVQTKAFRADLAAAKAELASH